MSNVVGLRGHVPSQVGVINDGVVELLKDLLERAEAGELNGIAVAMHYNDGTSNRCFSGAISYNQFGRLFELQTLLLAELNK